MKTKFNLPRPVHIQKKRKRKMPESTVTNLIKIWNDRNMKKKLKILMIKILHVSHIMSFESE